MTIGIDIRVLGNPIKSGIEEYLENLMPYLIKEGKDIQFKLFYSSRINHLSGREWFKEPNVRLYKFNYPNNLLFAFSRSFNRPRIDKMVEGAEVFFFPHFFLSSLSSSCKRVTTFHDLSFIHFPEYLTLRKKIWHNFQMMPKWQAKFSDKIIAVSESTKTDLINLYKIDPARIDVIYSGVTTLDVQRTTETRLGTGPSPVPDVVNDFKRSKNLPDRFILFLGKLEPRKNVPSIIKAFNNIKTNPKNKDVGLVIVGAQGWLCDDIIKEAAHSGSKEQIIFTNQISDEEKFFYYRAADVFVYPSFFEGFGFPPLEAMQYGVPVITSRNSSIPEVVSGAAVTIDPYDVNELGLWITKLLDDKNFVDLMVKKGVEQASKFVWHATAKRTLEALIGA